MNILLDMKKYCDSRYNSPNSWYAFYQGGAWFVGDLPWGVEQSDGYWLLYHELWGQGWFLRQ